MEIAPNEEGSGHWEAEGHRDCHTRKELPRGSLQGKKYDVIRGPTKEKDVSSWSMPSEKKQ